MIDYQRMGQVFPKQKAALTRAKKKGYFAVLGVCQAAVREWNRIGAWPDHWSIFQIALDDARYNALRNGEQIGTVTRLEDLQ